MTVRNGLCLANPHCGVQNPAGLTGFPAAVVNLTPISYYRMNETSGTTMTDTQGANPGTYNGALTLGSTALISHPADKSVSFPGQATAFGLAKAGFILAGRTNFSILAWVNITITPGGPGNPVYSERAAAGNDILKMDHQGNHQQFVYRDDAGTLNNVAGTAVINDGNPHMLVITKSGTAVVLYADGAVDGAGGTLTATNNMTDANPSSRVGNDLGGALGFTGNAGEVALFGSVLSAAQVTALFAAR